MPRIVENSDISYFILVCRKVLAYVYVLDGIATAIGEVGIIGSRFSPCQMRPNMAKYGGPIDYIRFHPVHVVNILKFQSFISFQILEATRGCNDLHAGGAHTF
jgi:hypothetical protein